MNFQDINKDHKRIVFNFCTNSKNVVWVMKGAEESIDFAVFRGVHPLRNLFWSRMVLLAYFITPSLFLLARTKRNNDKPRISDRENILMVSVGLLGYLHTEICSSDTAGSNALETSSCKGFCKNY
jgi:hypothetical protein